MTLLLAVALVGVTSSTTSAHAIGSFDNQAIADVALARSGDGGECKEFANSIVREASGGSAVLGGGYFSDYQRVGGIHVGTAEATKGDVIQLNGNDVDSFYEGMHTAIVVTNRGGGVFDVVDSNFNYDHTVRRHDWNPATTASRHGLTVNIWRLGTVPVPVLNDGTRFTRPGSNAQYLWIRGGALPISYADAVAFDAEGNRSVVTYSGPMPPAALPNNTVIRPVGRKGQAFLTNGTRQPIADPHTAACLLYSFTQGKPTAVVPASWFDGLPVGARAACALPDNTRFTQSGNSAQLVSIRGASLPVSYGDAVAYEAEGLRAYTPMPAGYVATHPATALPSNIVLRPAGQQGQFLYINGTRQPITEPATSACFVYSLGLPGVPVVPASWAGTLPTGPQAQCSLSDHTRFTETGSQTQHVSVRGAALPVTYDDALKYEAEGLRAFTTMPVGYLSNPIHAASRLPDNTMLRAVGTQGQYLYVAGTVRHVDNPTLAACLIARYPQSGAAAVPASWLSAIPQGPAATCP